MNVIKDVRICGVPWRELMPRRQVVRQFMAVIGLMLFLDVAQFVVPTVALPALSAVRVVAITLLVFIWPFWIMFAPIRRTPDEQAQYDRLIQDYTDALEAEILAEANKVRL